MDEPIPDQPWLDLEAMTVDDWGVRVTSDSEWHYYVRPMLANYRLMKVPVGEWWWCTDEYCYVGKDQRTYMRAIAAAWLWCLNKTDEPQGWNRNVRTGEWRAPNEVNR